MKHGLLSISVLIVGGGPCLALESAGPEQAPPNVLVIMADDLGWRDLGCYGSPYFDTPNIDALARQGTLFTNAYAAAPTCTPSRYAFLTGQHPARTGITNIPWFNQFIGKTWPMYALEAPHVPERLDGDVTTIAHVLQARGYATGQWGKWHMGNTPAEFGFDQGASGKSGIHDFPGASTAPRESNQHVWDKYLSEFPSLDTGEFQQCELVDKALSFIDAHRDQPWFYYYDPLLVHTPILSRHKWLIDKYTERFDEMGVTDINPTYAAMVETLDWTVGEILAGLERMGERDETIIIFTSDNGALVENIHWPRHVSSNDPLYGGKVSLHEGGIRVPLIVQWPGRTAPGTASHVPNTTTDLYPTILDMTGAPAPAGWTLDGESLAPALDGTGTVERDALFWHFPHFNNFRNVRHDERVSAFEGVIREGDWKLVVSYTDGSTLLFNLADDIGERTDLADEYPEVAERLKTRLGAELSAVNARMPVPNPNYDPATGVKR